MTIAVMSAIPGELDLLRADLKHDALLVESGIGKVNAASVTTEIVVRHGIETLVFTGVAGGVDPRLEIGDIVIGRRTIQHDAGVRSRTGFEPYQAGHLPFFNPSDGLGFSAPDGLVRSAMAAAEEAHFEAVEGRVPNVVEGTIVTGDQFVDDPALRQELHTTFGASAVEMEGAAVAQTAQRLGVACIVIRALSDLAGADAHLDFAAFLEAVAANSARLTLELVGRLHAQSA